MLTREQRATKGAQWLAQWQGWRGSGVSVAEYARREGFDVDAAYRWRRILQRTGQWIEADGRIGGVAVVKSKATAKFARVAVSDAPAAAPMVLRLELRNGRRAQIEIPSVAQLAQVLGVLEQAA